jgi:hydroxymethylglutaryl-CoA lyase
MRERILINEVGLRDGLQNLPRHVPLEHKLELFHALAASGLRDFEATSFVSPKAVPQLADAAELLARLPNDRDFRYTCLVPNLRGYERAKAAGARSIAVVLAATDTFNRKNINMSLEQATGVCAEVVQQARRDGIAARAYIAAAFACPFEGPTPPATVFRLLERMSEAGATELAVADTIGAANPRQTKELLSAVVRDHGAARVAAHFHDTRGLGSALAWAALEAGVRRFDGSIAGLGGCPFAPGASGNVATEDLVFMFEDCGFDTGVDFARLLKAVDTAGTLLATSVGGRIVPWSRSRGRAALPQQ